MLFLEGDRSDVKEIGTSDACPDDMQDVALGPGVFLRFRTAAKEDTEALNQWLSGEGRELLRNQLAAQNRAGARVWLLLHLARNCLVGISGFAAALALPPPALAEILTTLFSALPDVAADAERAIGVPLAPILEGFERRRAMH